MRIKRILPLFLCICVLTGCNLTKENNDIVIVPEDVLEQALQNDTDQKDIKQEKEIQSSHEKDEITDNNINNLSSSYIYAKELFKELDMDFDSYLNEIGILTQDTEAVKYQANSWLGGQASSYEYWCYKNEDGYENSNIGDAEICNNIIKLVSDSNIEDNSICELTFIDKQNPDKTASMMIYTTYVYQISKDYFNDTITEQVIGYSFETKDYERLGNLLAYSSPYSGYSENIKYDVTIKQIKKIDLPEQIHNECKCKIFIEDI